MHGADQAPVGGEVDVYRFLEGGGRYLLERAQRAEDARISKQPVQTPEPLQQGGGEPVDAGHVAQVERDQRRAVAGGGLDLVVELGQRLFRARRGDDVIASLGEGERGGTADPAGGAGDEDDAAIHGGHLVVEQRELLLLGGHVVVAVDQARWVIAGEAVVGELRRASLRLPGAERLVEAVAGR